MDREWMGEFTSLFFSGNREDFAKGIALKNNFIPQRLFQYKPLEPDEESEMIYAIDAIKTKTVHLSDPKSFNDPFDSVAYFSAKKYLDDKNFFQHLNISNDEIKQLIQTDTVIQEILENGFDQMVGEHIRDFARGSVKISCFSQGPNDKPTNMPMWYHYADKYKGICIEYNMDSFSSNDTQKKLMFPVEYADSIFDVTDYFYSDNPLKKSLFGIRAVVRKHNDWSYENEWRYIALNDKEEVLPFPAISAVYMGHNICESNEKLLHKIVQEQNIKLYKMKLGKKGIYFEGINTTDTVTHGCPPVESSCGIQDVLPKNQVNRSNIGDNDE
jgi:hypothetical protein